MELFLNGVWVLVAMASILLWLKSARRTESRQYLPVVALAMFVAILFPVISVSDDLWSLLNPAETDTCVRRNHLDDCVHAPLLSFALPTEAVGAMPNHGFEWISMQLRTAPRVVANPAARLIESRPPPAA
jgi:hypothetical protein